MIRAFLFRYGVSQCFYYISFDALNQGLFGNMGRIFTNSRENILLSLDFDRAL